MYSTCLYCTRDLGHNDIVEALPIGRRVAFDAGTGRLWVVCRGCERWNLVPFDTRLETIDACERLFRDTKLRFSTDNIGIARLPEGLELVRIGRAERPEFAAWRYGDQFGRRRIKAYALAGVTFAAGVSVVGLGVAYLPILGGIGGIGYQGYSVLRSSVKEHRARVRVATAEGDRGAMTYPQLKGAAVAFDGDDGWLLKVAIHEKIRGGFTTSFNQQHLTLRGDEASELLGRILPHLNAMHGTARRVTEAVGMLDADRSLRDFLGTLPIARLGGKHFHQMQPTTISRLPATSRLALEMVSHESSERAALSGELKLLERQWQEADKLAKIADGLVLED